MRETALGQVFWIVGESKNAFIFGLFAYSREHPRVICTLGGLKVHLVSARGKPQMIAKVKASAKNLKRDGVAMYFAAQDPRTPWYAKALALAVVAYLVSPIDLIPDFIPVLGQLDDLIIVPLGIALVSRLIPVVVMEESRLKATHSVRVGSKIAWLVAVIVISGWVYALWLLARLLNWGPVHK